MSAPAGHNQNNAAAQPAEHGAPEPDVLEVLSGFQASVESLKGLYTQRAAATAKLTEREAELSAHADRLKALEQELEERRASAARDREAMEQLHAQTEKRAADLAARLAEADRAREQVDKAKSEAERARTELEKSRAEIEGSRAEAASIRAQADAARAEADKTKHDSERARAEVDAARAGMEQARAELEKSKSECAASREAVNSLNEELTARQAELEAARNAVEAQRKAVEAAAAEVAAREVSFKTRAVEREAAASRAGEAEKQLKDVKSALAAEQSRARELESSLRAELSAAVKTRDDMAHRAGNVSENEQRLRADLEAATRQCASLKAVADEHARELVAAREELKRASLEMGAMASAGKQASSDADRAKLEKAAKAIVELRSERDGLKGQLSKAHHDLARAVENASKGRPSPARDATVEMRRRRVNRYRALVKEQSEKVKKATETLRSRFEAAEQLVAQRAELAEIHASVKSAERRAEKSKSKGRVAATMFYGIASALVLAFMCWVGTGWFTPGDFVATSTLAAEARTRELTDAERAEWQAFHEQILADPQFHEMVSDRLQRRAIMDYASAGAVRDLVRNNVQTRSAEDGQLVLELRGAGQDRTQRILDTVTTALASHANSSRHKRVDGASTNVRQPSTPSDQPVDNQRLVFAGLSWAVSLMLAFGVAAVLWRRMLNAKSTFERATRVDEVLDESRWQPLPTTATGRKGRARMGF